MCCLYEPNCDTGSTLRKAISHIFGRNKLCTRRIPDPVWVHWCRKHYQRSRYRNVRDYSQRQCELVVEQIQRIRDWSNRNKAINSTMVVRDWTLSMRKREQARIQDEAHKKGKKRTYSGRHKPEDEDDDDDHSLHTGTAVPDWLREKCSQVYATDEILDIAHRIRDDVCNGKLDQIPDIEILPNIPMDSTEKLKTPSRRKASSGHGHKRARSLYDRRPELAYSAYTHLPPLPEPYGSSHHEHGSVSHSRPHPNMPLPTHEGAGVPYHSMFRSSHSPDAIRSSHHRSVSASVNYPSHGRFDSRMNELSSPAFLSPPEPTLHPSLPPPSNNSTFALNQSHTLRGELEYAQVSSHRYHNLNGPRHLRHQSTPVNTYSGGSQAPIRLSSHNQNYPINLQGSDPFVNTRTVARYLDNYYTSVPTMQEDNHSGPHRPL